MAVEHLIKRTIWVAECPKCEMRDVRNEDPPKAKLCKCGDWVDYKEESAISPEYRALRR